MVTVCMCTRSNRRQRRCRSPVAKTNWRRLRDFDRTLTAQPGYELVGVLRVPQRRGGPLTIIARRAAIALGALFAATFFVYIDRGGYQDVRGEPLTLLGCIYHAAVTLSTTGYGDITPISEHARLINVVAITPLRVAFLVLLVGTTIEVVTETSRQALRIQR